MNDICEAIPVQSNMLTDGRTDGRHAPYHNTIDFRRAYKNWILKQTWTFSSVLKRAEMYQKGKTCCSDTRFNGVLIMYRSLLII